MKGSIICAQRTTERRGDGASEYLALKDMSWSLEPVRYPVFRVKLPWEWT